nr:MAG TPA: Cytosine specific methyltransferase [Caudoviricetes sp.]
MVGCFGNTWLQKLLAGLKCERLWSTTKQRERVFCVSILGEGDYQFPKKQPLALKLIDMLESHVDEKYYLSKEQVDKIKTSTFRTSQSRIQEKDWCDTLCARDYKDPKCVQVRPLGTIYAHASDRFGKGYIEGMSKTIKAISHDTSVVFSDYKIRKLTPKECWRLMGFDDVLFDRARSMCSNTQLYKQAGNSIVVDVVEQILDNLIPKEMR